MSHKGLIKIKTRIFTNENEHIPWADNETVLFLLLQISYPNKLVYYNLFKKWKIFEFFELVVSL